MLDYNPSTYLPSARELPDSDETPVDNELQNQIWITNHLLEDYEGKGEGEGEGSQESGVKLLL